MSFKVFNAIRKLSTSQTTCKHFVKHNDRVRNKMNKMFSKKNKFKYNDKVVKENFVSSQSWFGMDEKQINPKVLLREKRVSGLLIRELQDLVNSSIINEMGLLEVKITDVMHRNKNNCIVLWKSDNIVDAEETNMKLNMLKGKLKHYMIQSNVIGQVPNFHFRVDESLIQGESVEEILNSLQLDKTPHQKDMVDEVRITGANKPIILQEERKGGFKNKKTEITQDLFNVDQSKLNEKIKLAKVANR